MATQGCAHTHTRIHTWLHTHTDVHTDAHTRMHTHSDAHMDAQTRMHTRMHTQLHTHSCTYRCTHIHGCTHTHTCTHTRILFVPPTLSWRAARGQPWWTARDGQGECARCTHTRHGAWGPLRKQSRCVGQGGWGGPAAPHPQGTRSRCHQPPQLCPSPCPTAPREGGRMALAGCTQTCHRPPPYFCRNDLLRAPRSSSPAQNHQAPSFAEIKS